MSTHEIITGIDIGTSKIATLIAKVSLEERVPRIMGFTSVPSRGVKKGQIIDINKVTEAVEESVEKAERMAGCKIQGAYVSVGGPHITSLNSHGVVAVARPDVEISPDDIARVVEAAKAISLSSTREIIEVIAREYIVDGQEGIKNPTGMTGVRLEVDTHIITAGVTNLRNIERSLSDLGIEKSSYVFSGLASSLSTLSDTEKELGVVTVDIGGGKTDVCMYVDGALSYSSSIPMGARHITNDIAVGLRVSLDSAEKIKLFLLEKIHKKHEGYHSLLKPLKKDDVDITELQLIEGLSTVSFKTVSDGIIKPRLDEIFERVFDEIERSGYFTMVPSGLVITGGGAQTIGVVEVAKKVIGLSARIGIPRGVTGLVDEVMYPPFGTVVGLILYGNEKRGSEEKMHFKDFGSIFRNFSVKGSFKKVTDLFKSFLP